ncbi:hypothetical protein SMKI_13G0140 [Saccharomyces mikatae IFO 1815]|uniref:YML119W-like protein n=1 Tax=Saccharomyces mikatae IFO 1815 TaxID=226126 RepID=A0AA35IR40_SACMI|nr:uncharacterized protein SMKI_13G0140 [Saccharomyces mikatae IFO 1815]CAI4035367.1 hypothetical protein SMKI_13G0140 [Saccharomyces mikatae IFO 1815]
MSQSPSVSPRRTLNNKSSYISNGGGLALPPSELKLNQQPILGFQQKATFDSNQQFFYYPESPTKNLRPRFNSTSQINKGFNENRYAGCNNNGNRSSRYANTTGAANVGASSHPHHQSVSHLNTKSLKFNQTKEVNSIKDITFPPRTCTIKRYFTSPIDLSGARKNTSTAPALTNSPIKSKANFNIRKYILPRSVITTYKLSSPVYETIDDISKKVIILLISLKFEKNYHFWQPIQLSVNKKTRISKTLDELCEEQLASTFQQQSQLQNNVKSLKNPSNTNAKQRTGASVALAANESFELSFDGKAMDRSDIFRMVDSFSIAISDDDDDDDDEEDDFQQRSESNRILPAEILSNEPLE